MREVPTPFISEDHSDSPQGKPCGTGPTLYCPCCRHAFPHSESVSDEQLRATERKLAQAGATGLTNNSAPAAAAPIGTQVSSDDPFGQTDVEPVGSQDSGSTKHAKAPNKKNTVQKVPNQHVVGY